MSAMKTDISWNFLGLAAACLAAWLALVVWPQMAAIETFVFVLLAWIISVCVHEYSHAATASAFGDTTIADSGYLTLDPVKYINGPTSLIFPILALVMGGVALPGAAVMIRNDLIRRRWQQSLVALAGPASTLLIAIVVLILAQITQGSVAGDALMLLFFFELMAFVLNILPIPGLDGFGALQPFLPRRIQAVLTSKFMGMINLALFALIFFFGYKVIVPLMALIIRPLDIDMHPVWLAFDRFQFWR